MWDDDESDMAPLEDEDGETRPGTYIRAEVVRSVAMDVRRASSKSARARREPSWEAAGGGGGGGGGGRGRDRDPDADADASVDLDFDIPPNAVVGDYDEDSASQFKPTAAAPAAAAGGTRKRQRTLQTPARRGGAQAREQAVPGMPLTSLRATGAHDVDGEPGAARHLTPTELRRKYFRRSFVNCACCRAGFLLDFREREKPIDRDLRVMVETLLADRRRLDFVVDAIAEFHQEEVCPALEEIGEPTEPWEVEMIEEHLRFHVQHPEVVLMVMTEDLAVTQQECFESVWSFTPSGARVFNHHALKGMHDSMTKRLSVMAFDVNRLKRTRAGGGGGGT